MDNTVKINYLVVVGNLGEIFWFYFSIDFFDKYAIVWCVLNSGTFIFAWFFFFFFGNSTNQHPKSCGGGGKEGIQTLFG